MKINVFGTVIAGVDVNSGDGFLIDNLAIKKLKRYLPLYLSKLNIDTENLTIVVCKTGSNGAPKTMTYSDGKTCLITIWDTMLVVWPTVLYHELVHVQQLQSSDMDYSNYPDNLIYKGSIITEEILGDVKWRSRYWFLTSEREAYGAQIKEMGPVKGNLLRLWYLVRYGVLM